jgi:uncharacterized protein YkwD
MRSYATTLAVLVLGAFVTACPGGDSTPLPDVLIEHGDSSVSAGEQSMIDRHNATRTTSGLGTLAVNALLCQVAQSHANYMADIGQITHDDAGGGRVYDRAPAAGYNYVLIGENVAYDISADAVYSMWLESTGHYENITRPGFSEIGVGVATRGIYQYWCVVFGDR